MNGVNGVPQPDRHTKLGGKPISQPTGGGSSKSGGCLLVLLGLVSAPWAADLVLVAS